MAASSLLALIDDIATVLDDVGLMTKIAAKKTVGLLGDDLALNAQQVTGVKAEREIPVVVAVAKGSLLNKLILVPAALMLSAFAPWLIGPLLMLGGAYLCYEGYEKVWHALFDSKDHKQQQHQQLTEALCNTNIDLVAFEKNKIKGAIRTDFILSAEIIVIALGTVTNQSLLTQLLVVATIAFSMTIGVYGVVAAIVKLDDAGVYLMRQAVHSQLDKLRHHFGRLLLASCPYLMKTLSVVGTIAMFLVGGGILVHSLPLLHHFAEHLDNLTQLHGIALSLAATCFNFGTGIVAGGLVTMLLAALPLLRGIKN